MWFCWDVMKSPFQRSANVSSEYGTSPCNGPRPGYVARSCYGLRIGRGIVGSMDELTPLSATDRASRRGLSWFCFATAAALGALFVFTGCASLTGSLAYQEGPVSIGITASPTGTARPARTNIRATDGKNVIELQPAWSNR